MRRAQSNSPRIPPKKHHSFKEIRNVNLDNLLLLPGYKPLRSRPPSYPAHVSPSRDHLHVPRIRVTCVPDPAPNQPQMRHWSPRRGPRRGHSSSPDSRGRSPSRRVSRRMNGLLTPPLPPAANGAALTLLTLTRAEVVAPTSSIIISIFLWGSF